MIRELVAGDTFLLFRPRLQASHMVAKFSSLCSSSSVAPSLRPSWMLKRWAEAQRHVTPATQDASGMVTVE
jgi:hypothetical protein